MTTTVEASSKSPSPEHIRLLLRALHTYLPYSLPLYRRLQFHLSHPNPPYAQVFDAFSPLSPLSQEGFSPERWLSLASKQEAAAEQVPWLCSHIDLSAAGQTQVWVFANWELPEIRAQEGAAEQDQLEARRRLLQALFETIYDRDVPLIPEAGPKGLLRETKKQPGRQNVDVPFSRSRVLFGALNLCVRSLIPEASGERLDGNGTVHYLFPAGRSGKVITRVDEPYVKYLFPTRHSHHEQPRDERNGTEPGPPPEALPPGYSFGSMPYQYLPLVLERTNIPPRHRHDGVVLQHRPLLQPRPHARRLGLPRQRRQPDQPAHGTSTPWQGARGPVVEGALSASERAFSHFSSTGW